MSNKVRSIDVESVTISGREFNRFYHNLAWTLKDRWISSVIRRL
jgi:hypothetical protein